jgi:hypothetical protein
MPWSQPNRQNTTFGNRMHVLGLIKIKLRTIGSKNYEKQFGLFSRPLLNLEQPSRRQKPLLGVRKGCFDEDA